MERNADEESKSFHVTGITSVYHTDFRMNISKENAKHTFEQVHTSYA